MLADRLYGAMLRLYPASFLHEYEREMRVLFRRRWRDERGARRFLLSLSIVADTLLTAIQEQLDLLVRDVLYSLRALRRTPSFTVSTVAIFALGIGATSAICSLGYAVLLRPLPYRQPETLVRIFETNRALGLESSEASVLNFLSWQEQSKGFAALAAIRRTALNLTGDGRRTGRSGPENKESMPNGAWLRRTTRAFCRFLSAGGSHSTRMATGEGIPSFSVRG